MKRTGPLPRESAKRKRERTARRSVSEQALDRDRGCVAREAWQVGGPDHCAGPLDPDEYDLRSARPGGHLDLGNVQMVCRLHHDWKHTHPIQAACAGLRPWPRGEVCPLVTHGIVTPAGRPPVLRG